MTSHRAKPRLPQTAELRVVAPLFVKANLGAHQRAGDSAREGELSRQCEREFARAGVCGIRYTPDARELDRNSSYYGWIINGLDLYAALARASSRWELIECFPTATWSRQACGSIS